MKTCVYACLWKCPCNFHGLHFLSQNRLAQSLHINKHSDCIAFSYTLWFQEKSAHRLQADSVSGLGFPRRPSLSFSLLACVLCYALQLWIALFSHHLIGFTCFSSLRHPGFNDCLYVCTATMPGCPAEFLGRVWPPVLAEPGFASVRQGFLNSCS